MKIRALQAMTIRDPVSGELTAIGYGCIAEVDDELGASLIADGIAEAYTLISPTGTVEISENGEADVAQYAKANVDVVNVVLTYVPNGALGAVDAVAVTPGTEVTLSDGTGLTAPAGKSFAGWATTADASAADVTSPYTVSDNVKLFAVWQLPNPLTGLALDESAGGSATLSPAFDPGTMAYNLRFVSESDYGTLIATAASGVALAMKKGGSTIESGTGTISKQFYGDDPSTPGTYTIEVGTGADVTVYTVEVTVGS